jgi:N12 class adenine-specific DNA methylase
MKFKYDSRQASLFDDEEVIEAPLEIPVEVSAKTEIQEAVTQVVMPAIKPRDLFVLKDEMLEALNTESSKVKANILAVETLKRITAPGTPLPSPEDKAALAAFSGWGGLSEVFAAQSRYEWAQNKLKELLTPGEYASAEESVLTAYYTEPTVIRSIWKMVRSLGFEGGRILEPSCGVGHFIGAMPEDLRQISRAVMVDIDPLTSEIAAQLYADRQTMVHPVGIEKMGYTDAFDLVIGNVPFGNYRVSDKRLDRLKLNIHNYFVAKSIDMVRPGGLVAVITSTATLENGTEAFLKYVHARAELKMAVRLPTGAFGRLGGTDVVADILILQRRHRVLDEEVMDPESGIWRKSGPKREACENGFPYWIPGGAVNAHFVEHPERVLGKFDRKSNRWGTQLSVTPHGDWVKRLDALATTGMPAPCFDAELNVEASQNGDPRRDPSGTKSFVAQGFFFDEDGELLQMDECAKVQSLQNLPAASVKRMEGMTRIRDCALKLLEADASKAAQAQALRAQLNSLYDGFVQQYGHLMSAVNRRLYRADSHAPLLWSLEIYDDEQETAVKSDIFKASTVSHAVLADRAQSLDDAIVLSYNRFGRLNLGWMAGAMETAYEEVVDELVANDRIYLEPNSGQWVDSLEYLSGPVRQKYQEAVAAAKGDSVYARNVQALAGVVPPTVALNEVAIRLGVPWIDARYVEQWLVEQFRIGAKDDLQGDSFAYCSVSVTHLAESASWIVNFNNPKHQLFKTEWGTNRKDFWEILSALLNQQTPEVYDTIELEGGKEKRVINRDETLAAQEKAKKIQDAFERWIFASEQRVGELEQHYNMVFNGRINRTYDGSHLVVPGLNPQVSLRAAQKDSIWRGIVNGNTLYALAVGGGKTLIQICVAQESKRLGIAAKPVLVIPNHMLHAFAGEYLRAFPRAKVLAASKEDLQGDRRRSMLMRMATNDWDCIIVTHSTFGRIGLADEIVKDFIDEVKLQARMSVMGVSDKNVVREASRAAKQVETKLTSLLNGDQDKGLPGFESLGVDLILVDEADLFKNLFFFTKKKRIPGIASNCSSRALDLFIKSRVIFKKRGNDGHGLHFSTATPISNTIGEMFIMQTYLQEERLRELDINSFDAWAANFAREVTCVEVKPEGSGYRMHTRFASFVNVPELMLIFREVAEIRTKKQLGLPEPKLVGGAHRVVAVPASERQKAYVQELVKRAEKIRNGGVTPDEDNMLCVTSDGRKAALDMRIVDPTLADEPESKVNACIRETFRLWDEGRAQRLTQLIFSDLSVPGGFFSVYRHIKDTLMRMGVPGDEIAFAQDYKTDKQKAQLHREVRCGKKRVLLGSTELMGFGTNVQDRLLAKHDLDAPWRPRDVEQRDGRIIRQGNLNEEVHIIRYVTEGTFDAYSWQTLERKAGFIAQVMENNGTARTVEDVTMQALSFAEVKALASGNPMVIEKAGVDAEVARLEALKSVHEKDQRKRASLMRNAKGDLEYTSRQLQAVKAWNEKLRIDLTSFNVWGARFNSASSAAEGIMKRMAAVREAGKGLKRSEISDNEWTLFQTGNLTVKLVTNWSGSNLRACVEGEDLSVTLKKVPYGAERIADYLIEGGIVQEVHDHLKYLQDSIRETESEISTLQNALQSRFEHEEKYTKALQRQAEIDEALEIDVDDKSAMALEEEA